MVTTIERSNRFKKDFQKLTAQIQKKFAKQLQLLIQNPFHPSLHARKKSGSEVYEARIDIHYRFTYLASGKTIQLLTIGPHDVGLGKT